MSRLGALGYAITGFSSTLGALGYFLLLDRPLAFSSIGLVVLGVTMIALSGPRRPSPQLGRAAIAAFAYNAEALLEEADATGRAVIAPPRDGLSVAFVPVVDYQDMEVLARRVAEAPRRLSYAVAGVRGVELLIPAPPRPTSASPETAVREALVEQAEAAEAVRVEQRGRLFVVEAVRPRGPRLPRLDRAMGGFEGAMAGVAISQLIGSPVYVARAYTTTDGIAVELVAG